MVLRTAELIRDGSHAIATEWAARARQEVDADAGVSPLVLIDHIPELLAQLVVWMESQGAAEARRLWDVAHRHALGRLNLNFELREVVHEYRVLRRVLFSHIISAQSDAMTFKDLALVNEALDAAVAEAVDRFSNEREKQRLAEAERDVQFRELFLGIVSHDLRNPLNAILAGASMLLTSDQLQPRLAVLAGRIVVNAERMTRLIADLLDLTRGRLGGGIPITPAPANLRAIVRAAIETIEATHPDRHIVTEARGNLEGLWDPDRLGQVIGNLVSNALDHGDATSPVRIDLAEEGNDIAIRVQNAGSPIACEDLPHIFEAFRRGQGGDSMGLGLGLYIANEIIRAHGGRVDVTSTAQEGTTFKIILPRQARTQ